MKRIIMPLIMLLTLTVASAQSHKQAANLGVKPLTQYLLVAVCDDGIGATFRGNIEVQLKNLGFKVTTYRRPSHIDDMESYPYLKATRQGRNGTTKIEMESGEDTLCIIDFANQAEADAFVKSMIKSGYKKDGNVYAHPANGLAKIYAKVSGKRVKLISPFEMCPDNW
ncbi:MAG: hypothetical protein NC338_03230 [Firmicutes bacterium]|nr:hypothetical protein [Bacillota bacterium]MCM1401927.1 hypothetical protein [Bacteroides sp.]MCM1476651.1 hypothetical protein [Bacteroides sp.]